MVKIRIPPIPKIRGPAIPVVFGLAVLGLAAWLWVSFRSGSKETDLGSALIGGLLVGGILFYLERSYRRITEQSDRNTALGANPAISTIDLVGPTGPLGPTGASVSAVPFYQPPFNPPGSTGPAGFGVSGPRLRWASRPPGAERPPPPPTGVPIQAMYLGWQPDGSKVDAVQVRLQLQREGEYFQFVTVVVPSPDLRRWVEMDPSVTRERIWWHVANAAKPAIASGIESGEVPFEEPTLAFEVQIFGEELRKAVMAARSDREHQVVVGEPIFEIPIEPFQTSG